MSICTHHTWDFFKKYEPKLMIDQLKLSILYQTILYCQSLMTASETMSSQQERWFINCNLCMLYAIQGSATCKTLHGPEPEYSGNTFSQCLLPAWQDPIR